MTRFIALALLALTACSTITNTPLEGTAMAAAPEDPYPAYVRSEWHKRWYDLDKDCQDTRQEVLIAESTTEPVMDEKGCRVVSGTWEDPYTGKTFTVPGDLDVDHFIPLKMAHVSGGWAWDQAKRKAFSNELADETHLIAVDKSANRSKGSRGPDKWMPTNGRYHCEYLRIWLDLKQKWELSLTAAEARYIAKRECAYAL